MPSQPRFDAATIETLASIREVRIETTSSDGTRSHRTIIWIVTGGDQVFARSVNGATARWYREAIDHPEVVLHADGDAISARAVPANDSDTIQRVSDAFRAKYGKRSPASTELMVQPHTLETTIRLEPRDPET